MVRPSAKADRIEALHRLWLRQVPPAELWQLVDRVTVVGDATLLELLQIWHVPWPPHAAAALQISATTRLRSLTPRGRQLVEQSVFVVFRELPWNRTPIRCHLIRQEEAGASEPSIATWHDPDAVGCLPTVR